MLLAPAHSCRRSGATGSTRGRRRLYDLAHGPGARLGREAPRPSTTRTTRSPGRSTRATACGSSDWAEYFCRYAEDMRPFAHAREPLDLPGDNASYRRDAAGAHDATSTATASGSRGERRSRRGGVESVGQTPPAVVLQGRSAGFRAFLRRSAWHHGRAHGPQRGGFPASARGGKRRRRRPSPGSCRLSFCPHRAGEVLAETLSRSVLRPLPARTARLRPRLERRREPLGHLDFPQRTMKGARALGGDRLSQRDAVPRTLPRRAGGALRRRRGGRRRLDGRGNAGGSSRTLARRPAAFFRGAGDHSRASRRRRVRLDCAGGRADRGPLPRHAGVGRASARRAPRPNDFSPRTPRRSP